MSQSAVTPERELSAVVTKPGVYDIDAATYHADPCPEPSLSSSIGKLLVGRSPLHAWCAHPRLNPNHQPTESQKFDLGSTFHTLFLGKGAEVVAIEADDWRTKAAKEARDTARADGQIPMLAGQLERAQRMEAAVREQVPGHPELAVALTTGKPERTLVWQEENGIWCRAMLDWMPGRGNAYPDVKTTEASASPGDWGRILFNMGYDFQDAFYRRGLQKLAISEEAYLLFMVTEIEEPRYLIATHRCGMSAAALANRKVELAIALFGHCLTTGHWPGYRRETAWHDPKPWAEEEWLDREFQIEQFLEGAA